MNGHVFLVELERLSINRNYVNLSDYSIEDFDEENVCLDCVCLIDGVYMPYSVYGHSIILHTKKTIYQ